MLKKMVAIFCLVFLGLSCNKHQNSEKLVKDKIEEKTGIEIKNETIKNLGPLSEPQKFLSFSTEGSIYSQPVMYGNYVLFGSRDSNVYCITKDKGELFWKYKAKQDSYIDDPPTILNKKVYVNCTNYCNFLYVIDLNNGSLAKKMPGHVSNIEIKSQYLLTVNNGEIGLADINDFSQIWKFKAKKGLNNWKTSTTLPVSYKSSLIFGASDGNIYSLNIKTGEKLWSFSASDVIISPLLVIGNIVCFNSRDGFYYALNADSGKEIWKKQNKLSNFNAVAGRDSIFIINDNYLKVVDGNNGNIKYEIKNPAYFEPSAPPSLAGNNILYYCLGQFDNETGKGKGVIIALDIVKQKVIWKKFLNKQITTGATIVGGQLFIGTHDGELIGFK